jgi:hypothetical protein
MMNKARPLVIRAASKDLLRDTKVNRDRRQDTGGSRGLHRATKVNRDLRPDIRTRVHHRVMTRGHLQIITRGRLRVIIRVRPRATSRGP